ncbi:MAG: hypothetical protein AAFV07_11105 [Bacteroidota bacterium]
MKIPVFIRLVSLIAVVLLLLAWVLVTFAWTQFFFPVIMIAILLAYIPTMIAYTLTYTGLEKDTTKFVGFLLTGMLAKMLVGIIAIVVIAVSYKMYRNEFVVTYMVSYFVFTGFEVYGLIRKLRPNF